MSTIRILFLFILAGSLPYDKIDPEFQTLVPYLKDGLYGYADTEGNVVIEPQYEDVCLFGSKFTIDDQAYQETIKMKDKFFPRHLAQVRKDSIWIIIDKKGEVVLDMGWEVRMPFIGLKTYIDRPIKHKNKSVISNYKIGPLRGGGPWALYDRKSKSIKRYDSFRQLSYVNDKYGYILAGNADGIDLYTEGGYLLKTKLEEGFRYEAKEDRLCFEQLYDDFLKENPDAYSPRKRNYRNKRSRGTFKTVSKENSVTEKELQASILADNYHKIIETQSKCKLAQLGTANLPIHIYDKDFNLLMAEEVCWVERCGGDLVVKVRLPGTKRFQYRLISTAGRPYHMIDGRQYFDDIMILNQMNLNPEYSKSDKILTMPRPSESISNWEKGELPEAVRLELEKEEYLPHLKPSIEKLFSGPRYMHHPYRLFVQKGKELTRFRIVKSNDVVMDVSADEFISFNVEQREAKLRNGMDTITLKNNEVNEKLYRTYLKGIYSFIQNDSIYYFDHKDKLIYSHRHYPHRLVMEGYDFNPMMHGMPRLNYLYVLSDNRMLLRKSAGFLILDKDGEILDEINAFSHSFGHRKKVENWYTSGGKIVFVDKPGGWRVRVPDSIDLTIHRPFFMIMNS